MLWNSCCAFHQADLWQRVLDVSKAVLQIYPSDPSSSTQLQKDLLQAYWGLVWLNTSWFDFAPDFQKQGRLNDEGKLKKKSNENQRYLRHILCFTSPVVSEEPLLLCGFSEMGINLWCPWWKSCARAFSFGTMLKAGSCVTWAAGKSTERWDAAVEEVLRSPFLEELFSPEEEKVNVPLCVLPWAHPQKLDVQRIIRKLGHFP